MPVKTLIDCYYFYLKYSNQIDWLEIVQLAERFHAIEALQFSLKALSQLTSYDFMALTDFPSPHETVSTTFQSVYRRLNQENFIDLYLNRENPAYVRQVYWSRDFRFTQLPSTSESTANKHTFYLTNVFTSQSCKNTEHDIPYVSKPTYNKKATIFTIEAQKHILTLHIYFHLLGSLPNNNPSAISLYIDLIDYKTAAKNVFATTIGLLLVVDCTGKVLDINLLPDKYYDKFLIHTNITNQSKGDLSIDIRIPYSALSLFSKTPNRIIYNIELLQKNIGASYFQAMRTWNNTSLFDYTTMNVLEVPN